MNSRWSDADAQGLNDLDLIVYASRLIGAETTLVVWGGGNASVKRDERDHQPHTRSGSLRQRAYGVTFSRSASPLTPISSSSS